MSSFVWQKIADLNAGSTATPGGSAGGGSDTAIVIATFWNTYYNANFQAQMQQPVVNDGNNGQIGSTPFVLPFAAAGSVVALTYNQAGPISGDNTFSIRKNGQSIFTTEPNAATEGIFRFDASEIQFAADDVLTLFHANTQSGNTQVLVSLTIESAAGGGSSSGSSAGPSRIDMGHIYTTYSQSNPQQSYVPILVVNTSNAFSAYKSETMSDNGYVYSIQGAQTGANTNVDIQIYKNGSPVNNAVLSLTNQSANGHQNLDATVCPYVTGDVLSTYLSYKDQGNNTATQVSIDVVNGSTGAASGSTGGSSGGSAAAQPSLSYYDMGSIYYPNGASLPGQVQFMRNGEPFNRSFVAATPTDVRAVTVGLQQNLTCDVDIYMNVNGNEVYVGTILAGQSTLAQPFNASEYTLQANNYFYLDARFSNANGGNQVNIDGNALLSVSPFTGTAAPPVHPTPTPTKGADVAIVDIGKFYCKHNEVPTSSTQTKDSLVDAIDNTTVFASNQCYFNILPGGYVTSLGVGVSQSLTNCNLYVQFHINGNDPQVVYLGQNNASAQLQFGPNDYYIPQGGYLYCTFYADNADAGQYDLQLSCWAAITPQ